MLFAEKGYKTGAEIGVFRGQFAAVLCREIPGLKYYGVDTWEPSRNHRSARWLKHYFREARAALKQYDATLMKMTSMEASKLLQDGSLDFVYIDALHDKAHVLEDIIAWEPKVRKGGMVSGHDWTHPGVTAAVTEYIETHPVELFSTLPCEEDFYPSWYWFK